MQKNFILLTGALASFSALAHAADIPAFQVRAGYTVSLAAEEFGQARFLETDGKDMLWVSQPRSGTISTLKRQPNSTFTKIGEWTTGKNTVHGMDFRDGWLWFTQSGSVWKSRDTNGDGKSDEEIEVVKDLPSGGGHWYRSIAVADDGFFTSIGDSGNISDQSDTDRQKVWKFSLDGSTKTLWSSGIRNTEKLGFRPGTQEVWGADHGSDNFGKNLGERGGNQPVTDRIPPEEFNRYDRDAFYGHPFIVGNGMPRPEFAAREDILELAAKTELPKWAMGAHWAPNGWTFAAKNGIGEIGDAYVACHGSWNSSKPVGYRIERIAFDAQTGVPLGAHALVSMVGSDGQVLDRPVDVTEDADGSLLFSTDKGRVYRVSKIAAAPVVAASSTKPAPVKPVSTKVAPKTASKQTKPLGKTAAPAKRTQ